jgi:Ethanolamine utilization protein EutJ (predicted chaperonin)
MESEEEKGIVQQLAAVTRKYITGREAMDRWVIDDIGGTCHFQQGARTHVPQSTRAISGT